MLAFYSRGPRPESQGRVWPPALHLSPGPGAPLQQGLALRRTRRASLSPRRAPPGPGTAGTPGSHLRVYSETEALLPHVGLTEGPWAVPAQSAAQTPSWGWAS